MANFKKPKRFWSKVDVCEVGECWEWLASKREGYGRFWIPAGPNRPGRLWEAHSVAWILTYGPIPKGLLCCHHCDNPSCCNPYHLFLGTNRDNHIDAAKKGRRAKALTEDEVLEIRRLYKAGEKTQQDLADEFGVDQSAVSDIVRRETWGWL